MPHSLTKNKWGFFSHTSVVYINISQREAINIIELWQAARASLLDKTFDDIENPKKMRLEEEQVKNFRCI